MVNIVQLIGLNDANEITILSSEERLTYRVDNMVPLLNGLDPRRYRTTSILIGGEHSSSLVVTGADLTFNAVCDPDNCRRSLDMADQYIRQIGAPVINHPKNIRKTAKDQLWRLFGRRKDILVPKTIRLSPRRRSEIEEIITAGEMKFPFLFGEAGIQKDPTMVRIDLPEQMPELERFAFDGRDYYMTDFVNFRSRDGRYRKYRFFVIGDKVYPGYLIVANHWSIHTDVQARSTFQRFPNAIKQEEKTFWNRFREKKFPVFKTMNQVLGLDFFSIDCSLDEGGHPVLFRLSSCRHYLSSDKVSNYLTAKQRRDLHQAVERMIIRKLQNRGALHA